ncbi:MAG: hypothetical protein KC800_04865 [Candidatus Eremiobacteraeota bacterium]|nr:hypothetical protein [Candidatus Eremiobacteraeota bacterium]
MNRKGLRGLTIVEMMLVMTITALVFAVTQALLARTIDMWWKVNANADAQQQIYKAQNFLERDLAGAAYETEAGRETIRIEKTPAELINLIGSDGDVLWFLSAVDPVSGNFVRKDGKPFWQRNILYYAVTPTSLETFDFSGAGMSVGGYESACPFKVLIRKEIDFGDPTDPDSTDPEPLLSYSDLTGFLNRPVGYSTAAMGTVSSSVRPISGNILTFRADLVPSTRGVNIDLRATAVNRAKREKPIGDRDLSGDAATQQLILTLFPPNRQGSESTESEDLGGP